MQSKFLFLVFSMFFLIAGCKTGTTVGAGDMTDEQRENLPDIYQFTLNDIYGEPVNFSDYKGKVLVIVNTASRCGLTPQYEELQAFYEEYSPLGLEVLGFPANNFMNQEPGTDEDIAAFCEKNYGVTFSMFSKISVKGSDIHPLYSFLTEKEINGVINETVSWNFQKFIVGKDGKLVASIAPRTSIFDDVAIRHIKQELSK